MIPRRFPKYCFHEPYLDEDELGFYYGRIAFRFFEELPFVQIYESTDYPVADTVSRLMTSRYGKPNALGPEFDVSSKVDRYACVKIYFYLYFTQMRQTTFCEMLEDETFRSQLEIPQPLSQGTVSRIIRRLPEEWKDYVNHEIDVFLHKASRRGFQSKSGFRFDLNKDGEWNRPAPQEHKYPLPHTGETRELTPPFKFDSDIASIARELQHETLKPIHTGRTSPQYTKDQLLNLFVAAALSQNTLSSAEKGLKIKPQYDEVPSAEAFLKCMREYDRHEIRQMFERANRKIVEILQEYGYLEESEMAIDLTTWRQPFYGELEDYVQQVDGGGNYDKAWEYMTVSVVGADTPIVLQAKLSDGKIWADAKQTLRRAISMGVNARWVMADSDFYDHGFAKAVESIDSTFLISGYYKEDANTRPRDIVRLYERLDQDYLRAPYVMRNLDGDYYDHHLVVARDEKKNRRTNKDEDEIKIFYTNYDFSEGEEGEKLVHSYNRRWGIETSYNVVKENFLPKTTSKIPSVRLYIFNLAMYLQNLWTATNVIYAAENDEDPLDRPVTAHEFLRALEENAEPLLIEQDSEPFEYDLIEDMT